MSHCQHNTIGITLSGDEGNVRQTDFADIVFEQKVSHIEIGKWDSNGSHVLVRTGEYNATVKIPNDSNKHYIIETANSQIIQA
jgi:hypothetical protein